MMTAPSVTRGAQRLSDLLEGWVEVPMAGNPAISGLCSDSRAVRPGDLFLACAGTRTHALRYLDDVVRAGAAAVVYEPQSGPEAQHPAMLAARYDIPLYALPGLAEKLGPIAARFYGDPAADMQVVGITGTNGKTSCSQFLAQALDTPQSRCGVIGTLGYGFHGALDAGLHTTPDALTLHARIAQLHAQGARSLVMEVSSHALAQGRVNGVRFDIAVWTNLTRDHLDYHGDMQSYALAKRRLFETPGLRHAVINLDDADGRNLAASVPAGVDVIGYSVERPDDGAPSPPATAQFVRARDLQLRDAGLSLRVESSWGEGLLEAPVLGRFNASNLLAALGVMLALGIGLQDALTRLARVATVPGRMERFGGGDRPLVVVDYAHSPDALAQVLRTLREHCRGKLWCIFGCGGERDAGKRPLMAAVAERTADYVVITDDNPRNEDPIQIIADILAGMENPDAAYLQRDRSQAIRLAIGQARCGDVILVAGKGHEDYQQVGERRLPYSDREQVRRLLDEVPACAT